MAQYQTFPDAAGDSRTQEKLKALKLPDLTGRSFLDVGCNEGFFCGFARFLGAQRSVGLDHSKLFIERARQRFPECEFHHQGWERLPQGPFDVILLASALHYAEDQAELVRRLVEKLSPDGVLVLEMGIVSSPENAWVEVERGIDQRTFPTMAKLREILDGYAWKWMGKSVPQDGDPVARHVVHVSPRRPIAYLLMQPPAYGKTSISARLFTPSGVPVISGDKQIAMVAQGKSHAPDRLKKFIKRNYSPFRIDEVIQQIFDGGVGAELVHLWAAQAGGGDFALDAYVPMGYHAKVEEEIASLGYLPVQLRWDRAGPVLLPAERVNERAEAFYLSMGAAGASKVERGQSPASQEGRGYVDEISFDNGKLVIRGWAIDAAGALPECLEVRVHGRVVVIDKFEKQVRPDVQKRLGLPDTLVGYQATLELPGVTGLADLGEDFAVLIPSAGKIRLGDRVVRMLRMSGQP